MYTGQRYAGSEITCEWDVQLLSYTLLSQEPTTTVLASGSTQRQERGCERKQ